MESGSRPPDQVDIVVQGKEDSGLGADSATSEKQAIGTEKKVSEKKVSAVSLELEAKGEGGDESLGEGDQEEEGDERDEAEDEAEEVDEIDDIGEGHDTAQLGDDNAPGAAKMLSQQGTQLSPALPDMAGRMMDINSTGCKPMHGGFPVGLGGFGSPMPNSYIPWNLMRPSHQQGSPFSTSTSRASTVAKEETPEIRDFLKYQAKDTSERSKDPEAIAEESKEEGASPRGGATREEDSAGVKLDGDFQEKASSSPWGSAAAGRSTRTSSTAKEASKEKQLQIAAAVRSSQGGENATSASVSARGASSPTRLREGQQASRL